VNKKVIGIGISIVLALVGVFLVLSYVNEADERALADQETVELLVVADPVSKGEAVEDIADRVETILVPTATQARGSVASLADLSGQIAAVDLVPGEQVLASRFVDAETFVDQEGVDVPLNKLEVTVSLAPERAVGGQLNPGDTVAVVASFEPFQIGGVEPTEVEPGEDLNPAAQVEFAPLPFSSSAKTPNSSHIILADVLVTNIQIERLPKETDVEDAEESGVELAPTGNLLITLALDAPDVEKVIFSAEHGSVWLARDPTGGSVTAIVIQTRGTIYE